MFVDSAAYYCKFFQFIMDGDEDPAPGGAGFPPPKRKLTDTSPIIGTYSEDYKPFLKPGYKRLYPDNSAHTSFRVFVESQNVKEKIGNKSPIYLNHIFSLDIKGIHSLHRVNATKISVIFNQLIYANNFLLNSTFLEKHNMKAYIPAREIEKTGIIRYVPTNISNKDLYSKLSSKFDIIAVRRFTKKVGNERVPLQTVSITFLSNTLPDDVQYDLFSYRVFEYVPPLLQCFKCFKFNHSAKICNNKQRCSICAGEHLFKECDNPNSLNCTNCSGPHLAISRLCPIKMQKILEKKNKITYADVSKSYVKEFPALMNKNDISHKNTPVVNNNVNNVVNKQTVKSPVNSSKNESINVTEKKIDVEEIANNDVILKAIVKSLLHLANSGNEAISVRRIKDIFLSNLSQHG